MAISLKAARVNAGLTQLEAAKMIGVNVSMLAKWEAGTSLPSVKWVPKITEVYGTSYDDIIFTPNKNAKSVIEGGE